jgi:hypothetical protein
VRLQIGREAVVEWLEFAESVGRGEDPDELLKEMMLAYREFWLKVV